MLIIAGKISSFFIFFDRRGTLGMTNNDIFSMRLLSVARPRKYRSQRRKEKLKSEKS